MHCENIHPAVVGLDSIVCRLKGPAPAVFFLKKTSVIYFVLPCTMMFFQVF